jgi:hypothetical protein
LKKRLDLHGGGDYDIEEEESVKVKEHVDLDSNTD